MSLLPKAADEFRSPEYWDQFFDKVGNEAFEWYSDFIDLASVLCKYIKPRDEVLVIGCGNSTLSSDLYDTGITNIQNIDLSEKVIKQMKKQNEKRREKMQWLPMDARQMTFDDNQFSVVLDKGTFDALMSNRSQQVPTDINQMLDQIDRVLRMTGRFICITLAQKHILQHISQYFFDKKSWLLRYHHIQTSKSTQLPVFAFVFTKITMKSPLVEVQLYSSVDTNWLRFTELPLAINAIQQCQMTYFRRYDFKQKFVPGNETPIIDLYAPNNQTKRRYQMIVVNSRTKYRNKPFAAFIVPKSRNLDWLYSTPAGRQQIISSAQYTTVVFIYLQPDEDYRDLELVKSEMTEAVVDFKPLNLPENFQIPFLSSSEGIGQVKIREQSDRFIIEDCLCGDGNQWKRRLRFHANPNLIQSEINLTGKDLQPDYSILENDYHGVIITCLKNHFLANKNVQPKGNWLLIGLGGGVLTMKLIRAFPKVHLTGVDIDSEMIRLAKTWFGLDETLSTCIIDDGIQFLQRKIEEKVKYDVILFDVDNDDNQSPLRCPHPAFLEDQILENVKSLLSDQHGLFVLNFASRDQSNHEREDCFQRLTRNFTHLSSVKVDDDINEVLFASNAICLNSKSSGKIAQDNLTFNFDIEELLSKMIDRDSANHRNYVNGVKILDVEKRYRPGPKHYVYVIQVTWANPENVFIIYRRYTQFFDLQCKLLDLFAEAPSPGNRYSNPNRQIPFLPGKIFLGRSQIRQIALERKHALNIYLKTLISLPERISRSRPVLDFFQLLPTDLQNPSESPSNNKKSLVNNAVDISGPAKLPTYRCVDNFTAVEKTEMSMKRNTLVQVVQKHLNGWWFVRNGDRMGFVPGAFLKSTDFQPTNHDMPTSLEEPYIVNQSYEAKSKDEISLHQGSFVTVLEKSYTGWWSVKFNNNTGQFPSVYLTSAKGRVLPENLPEGSLINSNQFMKRLSYQQEYEPNDNNESPKETNPELYYVHSDYSDDVGDCVSLKRGDIVEIHQTHSSGWWLGRRLEDDFILIWIPSAFLQKDPINETPNSLPSHTHTIHEDSQQATIYQNLGSSISTGTVYSRIVKKDQSIASVPTALPSNESDEESTKISVRELVKKFNRQ